MKQLDETKTYYLSDLSYKQLKNLIYEIKGYNFRYEDLEYNTLEYYNHKWNLTNYKEKQPHHVNALELFYDECFKFKLKPGIDYYLEPNLQIGETFEYNGFICEVKDKVREPILVGDWIRNDENQFFKYEKWMTDSPLWTKIKDEQFISQLEKYSK